MTQVISVKFKSDGASYYFDPDGRTYEAGNFAVVETAQGIECGTVSEGNHEVEDSEIVKPLKKALRVATEKDIKKVEENKEKAKEAFKICEEKVIAHGLDMKLIEAQYSFDASKIIFFFTSDGRVDFRELVKDLAASLHTRIELRQIGVRDEARMLGGIGICGQPFCCSRFLGGFQPVSIKMAKEQGLSLNPTKISGSCGRLMCCLKYEQDAYEYLLKKTPSIGSTVKTEMGTGVVVDVNVITGNLIVKINENDGLPFKTHRDKVTVLSRGKNKKPVQTEEDVQE
ncbi:MAG: stage 0 sporulation family protein [Acutalibacteraceae bacterium]|nr:stage 0 sporulation family protein [Acutalibacteraceae bacterium]